jgi:hypothetical protein
MLRMPNPRRKAHPYYPLAKWRDRAQNCCGFKSRANVFFGSAIAQEVSRRLHTEAVRVRAHVGFVVDKVTLE